MSQTLTTERFCSWATRAWYEVPVFTIFYKVSMAPSSGTKDNMTKSSTSPVQASTNTVQPRSSLSSTPVASLGLRAPVQHSLVAGVPRPIPVHLGFPGSLSIPRFHTLVPSSIPLPRPSHPGGKLPTTVHVGEAKHEISQETFANSSSSPTSRSPAEASSHAHTRQYPVGSRSSTLSHKDHSLLVHVPTHTTQNGISGLDQDPRWGQPFYLWAAPA